jgi:hypothetical protein
VLDVNGTLTDRGELVEGVETQLRRIQETIEVHLVSSDTFGSLERVASILGVDARLVVDGIQKPASSGNSVPATARRSETARTTRRCFVTRCSASPSSA